MKKQPSRAKRDTRRRGDRCHVPSKHVLARLPTKVDLRKNVPAGQWPVWHQRQSSCTAHTAAGVLLFAMIQAKHRPLFQPSRRFLYHCEQERQKRNRLTGSGTVRYAIEMPKLMGVCAGSPARSVPTAAVWGDAVDFAVKPPETCFAFARKHRTPYPTLYLKNDLDHLRGRLAEGHPFTIMIAAYTNLEVGAVKASGDIAMPSASKQAGPSFMHHAMVVVGYDDAKRRFIVRNSFGTTWGKRGHGTIPYDYVTSPHLCDPASFWTLRLPRR